MVGFDLDDNPMLNPSDAFPDLELPRTIDGLVSISTYYGGRSLKPGDWIVRSRTEGLNMPTISVWDDKAFRATFEAVGPPAPEVPIRTLDDIVNEAVNNAARRADAQPFIDAMKRDALYGGIGITRIDVDEDGNATTTRISPEEFFTFVEDEQANEAAPCPVEEAIMPEVKADAATVRETIGRLREASHVLDAQRYYNETARRRVESLPAIDPIRLKALEMATAHCGAMYEAHEITQFAAQFEAHLRGPVAVTQDMEMPIC